MFYFNLTWAKMFWFFTDLKMRKLFSCIYVSLTLMNIHFPRKSTFPEYLPKRTRNSISQLIKCTTVNFRKRVPFVYLLVIDKYNHLWSDYY